MRKSSLLSAGVAASFLLFAPVSYAASECKSDSDCSGGDICVLVMKPPVCRPPQVAGSACIRDAGCASKKCDIAAGQKVGMCK
jgi:Dickkopf N-terminal cysteine-rich region